jgi:hypothetical protein
MTVERSARHKDPQGIPIASEGQCDTTESLIARLSASWTEEEPITQRLQAWSTARGEYWIYVASWGRGYCAEYFDTSSVT